MIVCQTVAFKPQSTLNNRIAGSKISLGGGEWTITHYVSLLFDFFVAVKEVWVNS